MNINLLVVDPRPNRGAPACFGGLPLLLKSQRLEWPHCSQCEGPMQYLGYVSHPIDPAKRVLFFQCQNEPGMCEEWDPESGGNKAVVVEAEGARTSVKPPRKGVTKLGGRWSGHIEMYSADSYSAAHIEVGDKRGYVLGQLGGSPDWIQDDETPECPSCGRPMVLAAQLEEGPVHRTAMNFGGCGNAYVFVCPCPAGEARFLWQC